MKNIHCKEIEMVYKKVTSSNIISIAYDAEHKWLGVEFSSGSIYQYFDVPKTVYDSLMYTNKMGGSVGKLFNVAVKGVYEFVKVN